MDGKMKTIYGERLGKLCENTLGQPPLNILEMSPSGSQRRYFRLILPGGDTAVACCSPNVKENGTFLSLSGYLSGKGLNTAHVIGVDPSGECYILEDLGNGDLMGLLKARHEEGRGEEVWNIIEKTIRQLVDFQLLPKEEWDEMVEFPPLAGDLINHDFRYAVDNLIEPLGIAYDAERLKRDFKLLESRLLGYPREGWGLMYRDFQSRNIMVKSGSPYLIDFQSSRYGPGIYDLVSFAWQAKAAFSKEERGRIIEMYEKFMAEKGRDLKDMIRRNIGYWAAFRVIQTLGAYGLRGLIEGKRHFIESIPLAVDNLNGLMDDCELKAELPELGKIVSEMPSFL